MVMSHDKEETSVSPSKLDKCCHWGTASEANCAVDEFQDSKALTGCDKPADIRIHLENTRVYSERPQSHAPDTNPRNPLNEVVHGQVHALQDQRPIANFIGFPHHVVHSLQACCTHVKVSAREAGENKCKLIDLTRSACASAMAACS
mmetsp:Transcript_56945/g.140055  ORF Transcript_56945/g.140055 Transcript_56945/m.140055 type:complete len:147 (+) Transcript_56945:1075-1515(+)